MTQHVLVTVGASGIGVLSD